MIKINKVVGVVLVFLILSGCAVTNTFVSYQSRSAKFKTAIDAANESSVLVDLSKKRDSSDKQLYLAERARIAYLAGMIEESIVDLNGVMEAIDIQDEKAKVTVTGAAAKTGAALSNDSVIPYSLDSYEKVMAHHYQALNYIAQGNKEAAGIEIRRANFLQSEALEAHTKELAKVEEEAQKNKVDLSQVNLDEQLSAMDDAIGEVKNSFQNAYTFYLSGLVFEALGSRNDAYIDYRKSLEINPDNIYIQNDVLRLAKTLGMREDLQRYKKRFNRDIKSVDKNEGSIVVFYEDGYVPEKVERRMDFPNFMNGGFVSVAMPIYDFVWTPALPIAVDVDGESVGNTQTVLDLSALAAKSLKEEFPGMVVRQIARAITKAAMQEKAKKENTYAGVAMAVLNLVSERADLRAWSTLPNKVQVFRSNVAVGPHKINLSRNGVSDTVDVDVKSNKITIIYVANTGRRSISRVYTL